MYYAAKLLFPEDPHVQPPVEIKHESQLQFLDEQMLLHFVPGDDHALVFAMQTFLYTIVLLMQPAPLGKCRARCVDSFWLI